MGANGGGDRGQIAGGRFTADKCYESIELADDDL